MTGRWRVLRGWMLGAAAAACAVLGCGVSGSSSPIQGARQLTRPPALVGGHSIVFDGSAFAVAWAALPEEGGDECLWFERLSADGDVVTPPRLITHASDPWQSVSLFATDEGYVVWHWGAGTSLQATVLDRSGSVQAEVETDSHLDPGPGTASVALAGDVFGAAYRWADRVRFRRFSLQGLALGPEVDVADGNGPQVVVHGGDFALVWTLPAVWTSRFSPSGAQVQAPTMLTDRDAGGQGSRVTDVAGGLIVGWLRPEGIGQGGRFLYVRDDGMGWPAPRVLFPASRAAPLDRAMAAGGGAALVVWQSDADAVLPHLFMGTLDLAAGETSLANVQPLTPAGARTQASALAVGPESAALLFTGDIGESRRLFFRRVDLP